VNVTVKFYDYLAPYFVRHKWCNINAISVQELTEAIHQGRHPTPNITDQERCDLWDKLPAILRKYCWIPKYGSEVNAQGQFVRSKVVYPRWIISRIMRYQAENGEELTGNDTDHDICWSKLKNLLGLLSLSHQRRTSWEWPRDDVRRYLTTPNTSPGISIHNGYFPLFNDHQHAHRMGVKTIYGYRTTFLHHIEHGFTIAKETRRSMWPWMLIYRETGNATNSKEFADDIARSGYKVYKATVDDVFNKFWDLKRYEQVQFVRFLQTYATHTWCSFKANQSLNIMLRTIIGKDRTFNSSTY
jgi:hypothetical protein